MLRKRAVSTFLLAKYFTVSFFFYVGTPTASFWWHVLLHSLSKAAHASRTSTTLYTPLHASHGVEAYSELWLFIEECLQFTWGTYLISQTVRKRTIQMGQWKKCQQSGTNALIPPSNERVFFSKSIMASNTRWEYCFGPHLTSAVRTHFHHHNTSIWLPL